MLAGRAVLATASTASVVYFASRLYGHISSFAFNECVSSCGGHNSSVSWWAWLITCNCYRAGFLWPALLLLVSGLSSAGVALISAVPSECRRSDFANDGSAPLSCMLVGPMKRPVRRPPGPIVMFDNRLRIGLVVVLLLAIQATIHMVWWQITNLEAKERGSVNNNDYLFSYLPYSKALAESTAMILACSAACHVVLWRSNRMYYAGIFPWILPAIVGLQLASVLVEKYVLLFIDNSPTASLTILSQVHILYGGSGTILLASAALCTALLVSYSCAQQRPIFLRPAEHLGTIYSSDCLYTQNENRYSGSDDCDESTPLTHQSTLRSGSLVDTPEFSSSWFDRITYSWVNDMLSRGFRRQLQSCDMYRFDRTDTPEYNWRRYSAHRKPGRPLFLALFLTYAPEFALQAVLSIAYNCLKFCCSFFLQRIIRTIEMSDSALSSSPEDRRNRGYLDAFCIWLCVVLISLAINWARWIGRHIAIGIKEILIAELTSKVIKSHGKSGLEQMKNTVNSEARPMAADDGKIINMLTSDAERVFVLFAYIDELYCLPFILGIGVWYMYRLLGASALVGLLFFAAYVPLTKSASARLANVEKTVKDVSDKRVSIITEVVQGIRAVKLFGWESCFVDKINKQRSIQLEKFWLAQKWQICVNALAALGPVLIPIVMFTVYVAILGNKLTAEIAFTSISVFQVVRFVFENGSELIGVAIRASVSLNRIESYLEQNAVQGLEDRVTLERSNTLGFEAADLEWAYQNVPSSNVPANSKHIDSGSAPDESTLLLATESSSHTDILPLLDQGLSTSPPPELQRSMRGFTLRDINVEFPTGGFSLVAGPTGSGKSSLLAALIGEMTLTRGRILLPTMHSRDMADEDIKYKDIIELSGDNGLVIRDIAYVAQEAWLRNATVRENILFDEPYNRERYEQVLHACALKPDLRVLLAGDQTEIGERGVTLSGGQKQRVALARAVYSSRSILLIDDCLSAVDAHTAKHILTECLANSAGLMQSRTRVLVTHHVSMCLPYAQYIVAMCEGRVVLKGVPADLQDHQGLALTAMSEHNRNVFNTIAKHDSKGRGKMTASATTAEENPLTQTAQLTADTRSEDEYNSGRMETIREQKEQALGDSVTAALQGTLVEEEKRETGSVRLKVWKMYFAACGSKSFWVWSLILLVSSRGMVLLHDYWIRIWVVSNDTNGGTIPRSVARHSVAYWLGIYVLIGLASVVWRVFLLRVMYRRAIKASMTIHSQLLKTMMRATPRFFNSTPIGRIINRFSRDMDVIDASVMNVLVAFASDILLVLITYAVILSAAPLFIFVVAFITLLFSWFGFYYANTCRELKRLEANSMSPLLSLFSELIQGVSTIRAFGVKHLYIKEANNRLCAHLQPLGITWLLYRWIGLRCDMTGSLVSFSCAMFVLYNMDWVDAGLAGFVLSYSLSFTSRMIWVVRNYTVNETNMNAVERVMQYMDTEQEASLESDPQNQPPPSWPRKGDVQIENLVAEYVPGVPVLHGISLSIKHGEKIGIVGRTGAGKSTMSLALLRFIEASKGRVVLDGVDISRIGLEDLRRNVTIIPQDPVLFNGSIRSNLDPLDEHPDELLWEALRRTHLIKENDSQNTYGSSSSSSISVTSVVEGGGFNSGNTSGDGSALERMAGIFTSLDAEIKENGQNLSLGQRQLVALARALVRRSKLIIMDEATASVDFDTDNRIQNTIRGPEFANSTLLCIAHRLRTIIDYDRVLVLDNGKVAELDTPYNLLQNKDGIFRSMCEKSGEREYLYSAAMSMSTTRCKTSIIN